jgi:hypothetical protein
MKDPILVQIERKLSLHAAGDSLGQIVKDEFSEEVVVLYELALSLEDLGRNA